MSDSDIPPQSISLLSKSIGRLCSYRELDGHIRACDLDETIEGVSFENQPRNLVARDCISWALKNGVLRDFIDSILRARKDDPEAKAFKTLVVALIPPSFEARSTVRSQVNTVISGLDQLNTLLNRDEVRRHLDTSRQKLTDVRRRINLLAIHKDLHDHLHHLQITPTHMLLRMAQAAAKDHHSLHLVRAHLAQVDTTVSAAQALATKADAITAAEGAGPQLEPVWIGEMRAVAKQCKNDLADGRIEQVCGAIKRLADIAEGQSLQLNKNILFATTKLPLTELASTLSAIGQADKDIEPSLRPAIAAIGDLHRTLVQRALTHNQLQAARQDLTFLTESLDEPGNLFLPGMAELWPATRAILLNVRLPGVDAETSCLNTQDSEEVDNGLVLVARALGEPGFDPKTNDSVMALQEALIDFQFKANAQFFEVDCKLKGDFDNVNQISERLETTLGTLS